MNNLKRILSLALASVMVLGMMVVGASAASFTDDADITNDAAVDVMSALGIIGGYEDGAFRPNGDVTRAEMAKMLSVALNGGKDPNVGLPATIPFSDVKANDWFAEYVMYCSNLGIIGGRGDGSFDPYGKVTAAEAAKMMLVALGFDAEIFELVGSNWSANTMRLAQTLRVGATAENAKPLSLFGGLSGITANTTLNRDQTAQLIYNGIQSNTVLMALTGVAGSGTIGGVIGDTTNARPVYSWSLTGKSILEDKFKASMEEGVLKAVNYTPANQATNTPASWRYTLALKDGDKTFTTRTDVSDLFMQKARVVYRNSNNTLLSITPAGNSVVKTVAWGKKAANPLDGTLSGCNLTDTLTLGTLPVYTFLNTTVGSLNSSYNLYDSAKLIDNNGDGKLDCVVVTPVSVAMVNNARPTYIHLDSISANVPLTGNNVEEGLAVGDYVTYTKHPLTQVLTIKKAEILTGKVAASMDASQARINNQVQVDGTWYAVHAANYNTVKGLVGENANLVLVEGYIYTGSKVDGTSSSNAVMLVATAQGVVDNKYYVDSAAKTLEIKILNADNKTQNLKVSKINPTTNDSGTLTQDSDISKFTVGALYTYATDPQAPDCVILKSYTPTVGTASSDKYTVSMADGANTPITIKSGLASGTRNGSADTFRFADDAVIFILVGGTDQDVTTYADNKYTVVTGADVNKWGQSEYKTKGDANNADGASVLYAKPADNGFTMVREGALVLGTVANNTWAALKELPGASGTVNSYGYVTANAYYTLGANNTPLMAVPVWNGTENVTIYAKTAKWTGHTTQFETVAQSAETDFTAGTFVTYVENGDGTAKELAGLTQAKDAIVAWDNAKTAKFYTQDAGKELTIDDKTIILYVDDLKGEGVASANVVRANPVDAFDPYGGYYTNVHYVEANDTNGDQINDHVKVLILDSNNVIYDANGDETILGQSATAAPTNIQWKDTKNQTIATNITFTNNAGSIATAGDETVILSLVGAAQNLTVAASATNGGTATLESNGTVTVKNNPSATAANSVVVTLTLRQPNRTPLTYTVTVAFAAPAAQITEQAADKTLAELAVGTHTFADGKKISDKANEVGGNCNWNEVVVFIYKNNTATAAQNYTLSIKSVAGTEIYNETVNNITNDSNNHYFLVCAPGTHNIAGSTTSGQILEGASYTWTITGADNTVYGQGAFKY